MERDNGRKVDRERPLVIMVLGSNERKDSHREGENGRWWLKVED